MGGIRGFASWVLNGSNTKDLDKQHNALMKTKIIQDLKDSYENMLSMKDMELKALKRTLKTMQLYEDEGLIDVPLNVKGGLVDALIGYVKEREDIPKLARGPIIAWLTERKPWLEGLANGIIEEKMAESLEAMVKAGTLPESVIAGLKANKAKLTA